MDDLHDETSDLAAHVADELASANDLPELTCAACAGTGWILAHGYENGWPIEWKAQCATCHGRGRFDDKEPERPASAPAAE